jgi:hypothetical protein
MTVFRNIQKTSVTQKMRMKVPASGEPGDVVGHAAGRPSRAPLPRAWLVHRKFALKDQANQVSSVMSFSMSEMMV